MSISGAASGSVSTSSTVTNTKADRRDNLIGLAGEVVLVLAVLFVAPRFFASHLHDNPRMLDWSDLRWFMLMVGITGAVSYLLRACGANKFAALSLASFGLAIYFAVKIALVPWFSDPSYHPVGFWYIALMIVFGISGTYKVALVTAARKRSAVWLAVILTLVVTVGAMVFTGFNDIDSLFDAMSSALPF